MAFKARIATNTAPSADRFILCGRPGVGKTYFASTIPNVFLLFVEDGSKGIAPGHDPHLFVDDKNRVVTPTTLRELIDAIDMVARESREKKIRHLVLDSFTDVERLVHAAACGQERVSHMEAADYKKIWAAAIPHWLVFQARLDRIRALGIHVWICAHGTEMFADDLTTGDSWRRLHLAVSGTGTTAAEMRLLWTKWADHFLFLDFEAVVKPGSKKKRTTAEYRGRVLHTRESASHFAKSRSELRALVPATWLDLSRDLTGGTQVTERRLRARLATALEELEPEQRAEVEAQVAKARNPKALAAALSRAEGLAAVAAREAAETANDEDEPEPSDPGQAEPEPEPEPDAPPPAETEPPPVATRPPAATEPAPPPAVDLAAFLRGFEEADSVEGIAAVIELAHDQLVGDDWAEAVERGYSLLINRTAAAGLKALAKQIHECPIDEASRARLRGQFVARTQAAKGAAA